MSNDHYNPPLVSIPQTDEVHHPLEMLVHGPLEKYANQTMVINQVS